MPLHIIMRRFVFIAAIVIALSPCFSPATAQQSGQKSTVADRFAHAVELFETHDDTGESLEEAEKEFAVVLQMDPRHAPALAYQGLIALERQKPEPAEAKFGEALRYDPNCAEAHVGMVRLFRLQGKWEESYRRARLAVQLAPASMLARWELVGVLIHRAEAPVGKSERREAALHLLKIIELDPQARDAHLYLADIYREEKQCREAIPHYKEVLRIGQLPDDGDVWVYEINKTVAGCYESLGEYEGARDFMRRYLAALEEIGADQETLAAVRQKISDLGKQITR